MTAIETGYAVVDCETTGLFPGSGDRIVEIAVVRLDGFGEPVSRYSTLLNPDRDVGPTHIHGITAADVVGAPRFEDVVGDIVKLLEGAAFVAHNASFDRRFLFAETARAGVELPELPTLCTMKLARQADPSIPGRKLEVLCDHFGILLGEAHSADADAQATSELFRICVDRLGGWSSIDVFEHAIKPLGVGKSLWPRLSPSGRCYCRDHAASDIQERHSYIQRLVSKLPACAATDPATEDYSALLDRVLEDRHVEAREMTDLLSLATELGMSCDQAKAVHRDYLQRLMLVALEDRVITPAEQHDIDDVRVLLGLGEEEATALMRQAKYAFIAGTRAPEGAGLPEVQGKSVCFTGAMVCHVDGEVATRRMARDAAERAGMNVRASVTKSLDYLVVADPETMSGKAKKAREYGTRIIAESVFWKMVGIAVE